MLAAVLLAVAAGNAPAARAAPGLVRIVQDDAVLVRGDPATRDRALAELRDGGADVVRALVHQSDAGAGRWDGYDALVGAARAHGLRVLFTLSPRPRASPTSFGRFAQAAARRYGDRVALWALVNEPNSPRHVLPQRRGGRPASPAIYRRLVHAGLRGLSSAGVPARRVLLGELLGTGSDRGSERAPVRPLTFTRAFFCLDRRDRPRRCSDPPRRLRALGWSFHPYPLRGGPGVPPRSRDDVTATHLEALRRTLDAAWRAGRTARRLPLWDTEGGVQTDPPDRILGVAPAVQACFINQIEWVLWRTPTVRSVAQYLWRDEPDPQAFQSGLRYADGRAKPSLGAWRLPLYLRRTRSGALEAWAHLPPGVRSARLTVGGRVVRRLAAERDGTAVVRVRARPGTSVRVRAGALLSRRAAAPGRRSRSCRR